MNCVKKQTDTQDYLWLHGSVAECQSSAGELSLSCAQPAADG